MSISARQTPEAGVPTVDFALQASAPAQFIGEIGAAYDRWGFCGISNHGLDDAVVTRAYDAFQRFFGLPDTVKSRYALPDCGGIRGYTAFGIETAKGASHSDLKEFWHVGRDHTDHLMPNIWPREVSDFQAAASALYDALDDMGRHILSAIACYLGLAADWFEDKVVGGDSILRAIHYPPIRQDPGGSVRAAAHEDINLITLLVGSEQAGLEILSREGDWIPVTTLPGTIMCNIGDMMQRLTNHRLPSTTHRVVNPPGPASQRSRYSMPFFLHPNPTFLIKTLSSCITADHPDRYPTPITAYEYLQQRLREIKLK